jgi:hypothetical protein
VKIDMNEYKARKNGIVTPESLIENLLAAIERGEIEKVAFVVKKKDGEVRVGYSHGSQLEHIGLLQCGINEIIAVDMGGDE